ncbi:MAG: aspartate ammonia-lyase [Sulfobacillus sp.]
MRQEKDSLGMMELPDEALYGIQTARAKANFPISQLGPDPLMVDAMVRIKKAAARTHMALGVLAKDKGKAIVKAADEVLSGHHRDQFIVDVFQAGAGTSHNMNTNEVLANRALEILGHERGEYEELSPNDHVNMSQSTNDAFPTAIRLACLDFHPTLERAVTDAVAALGDRAQAFADILKSGRTHLQDAVPMTLGQEFGGYAATLKRALSHLQEARTSLLELNLGATAIGSGLNTPPGYRQAVVKELAELTDLPLKPADNAFQITQSLLDFGRYMAALKSLAIEVSKVCSDLRLLSSGPTTGLRELTLPAVQPGSSIMPGKVNPSMLEMMNMVCFEVIGQETAVSFAVEAGQLELNVMMPLVAYAMLFSMRILANGLNALTERCLKGIEANREVCHRYFETSNALATALAPVIGYLKAAELAKEVLATGRTIRQVAVPEYVDEATYEKLFQAVVINLLGKTE